MKESITGCTQDVVTENLAMWWFDERRCSECKIKQSTSILQMLQLTLAGFIIRHQSGTHYLVLLVHS